MHEMQQHDAAPERPDEAPAPATNTSEKTTTPQQTQIPTLLQRRTRVKLKDPSAAYDLRGRGGIAGDTIHVSDSPSPPSRYDLTTPATQRREQHKHVPAEAAGQCSGLLPLHARNNFLGEGHEHANMTLGPVQGTEHGAETTPNKLQGKHWE